MDREGWPPSARTGPTSSMKPPGAAEASRRVHTTRCEQDHTKLLAPRAARASRGFDPRPSGMILLLLAILLRLVLLRLLHFFLLAVVSLGHADSSGGIESRDSATMREHTSLARKWVHRSMRNDDQGRAIPSTGCLGPRLTRPRRRDSSCCRRRTAAPRHRADDAGSCPRADPGSAPDPASGRRSRCGRCRWSPRARPRRD